MNNHEMNNHETPSLFHPTLRLIFGIVSSCVGMGMFLIGASPASFGVDRSPMLGTIQIVVLGIGLGLFSLGACLCLLWLWQKRQLSIGADFGWRLVATGYVVALWSAMADLWGFGTSEVSKTLCFGPWQERGVMFGEIMIGFGLLLMVPWKRSLLTSNKASENQHLQEGTKIE